MKQNNKRKKKPRKSLRICRLTFCYTSVYIHLLYKESQKLLQPPIRKLTVASIIFAEKSPLYVKSLCQRFTGDLGIPSWGSSSIKETEKQGCTSCKGHKEGQEKPKKAGPKSNQKMLLARWLFCAVLFS